MTNENNNMPKNGQTSGTCTRLHDQPDTEAQKISEMDCDEIQSTKYCCGISGCFKLWQVKRQEEGENEKMLDMKITVESLRLATNGSFFILIILGIIATKAFNDDKDLEDSAIEKTFGNRNICLYFDYPPIPYFAPFLYNFTVLLVTCYSTASMFRVWISHAENKITKCQRKLLNFCFGFLVFAAMLFSQCFAVQPKNDENHLKIDGNKSMGIVIQSITLGHETMLMHTIPFMILELALTFAQVAVVCFGKMVAWKKTETGEHIPKWFVTISIVHVILMCIITAIKIVFQLNALGDYQKGLWWTVDSYPNPIFSTIVDWTWFTLSFAFPLLQSFYLTLKDRKTYKTQILNITITDNRKAK